MSSAKQRYVSKELIHMVGKNKTEEEQYLLMVKILQEGCLCNPENPGGNMVVNPNKPITEDTMFNVGVVCFCDIPIDDLAVHIAKYSKFGLSFLKEFLIKKGVNPVYYVAMNSIIEELNMYYDSGKRWQKEQVTRAEYFNRMMMEVMNYTTMANELILGIEREEANAALLRRKRSKGAVDRQLLVHRVTHFLNFELFSRIKLFDDKKSDGDDKNYYMEREWRILGSLNFKIDDLYRVILPREKGYAERLRKDVPNYVGQPYFVD